LEEEQRKYEVPRNIKNLKSKIAFAKAGYHFPHKLGTHSRRLGGFLRQRVHSVKKIPSFPFPMPNMMEEESNEIQIPGIWQDGKLFVDKPFSICSPRSGYLIAYFKRAIPEDMVNHITKCTNELVQVKPKMMYQRCRGRGNYYLFGYHRFCQKYTIPYRSMFSLPYLRWIVKMKPYFALVEAYVHKNFPSMVAIANKRLIHNPLFPYTSGQVNVNTCVKKHIDHLDHRHSLSCLTTIGTYTGGELFFHELQLAVQIEKGDLLFFQGSKLQHSVLLKQGERTSINLYMSSNAVTH
jgi:hypothetical protein